ncbi:MAG: 5-formyltetrahydrofolate cyclo-ligase [Campylobacteraceae bacterium]|jgi:5-formyltetrahydrofolate cyclo-ligase|nr:5-formyltetrahydrofolate cyclo-ligase [Campylobacteraceae bacterium]
MIRFFILKLSFFEYNKLHRNVIGDYRKMLLKSTNGDEAGRLKKDAFRKESLARLKTAASRQRVALSHIVSDKLRSTLKSLKAKNIMLYMPLENEVDILCLMKEFRKYTKIYVPFMGRVSFKLVKYRLPVQKKNFNILEPPDSFMRVPKIDVAIVPVVGVDGNLKRIGFGKGMYDRFFDTLSPKPFTIFVQLAKCFTAEKLCEDYDVQADIYITPSDTIIKRGNNVFRIRNRRSCRSYHGGGRICYSKKN